MKRGYKRSFIKVQTTRVKQVPRNEALRSEWLSEKTGQNVKNVNGRGSTETAHTNIIDRLGRVMDKYDKHRFFTALVLERRASLYLTPSDAIFVSKI